LSLVTSTPTNAAPLVAVRKNLDLVWVWFYKEVAPTALFLCQKLIFHAQNAISRLMRPENWPGN
jgi:hypothetical protein